MLESSFQLGKKFIDFEIGIYHFQKKCKFFGRFIGVPIILCVQCLDIACLVAVIGENLFKGVINVTTCCCVSQAKWKKGVFQLTIGVCTTVTLLFLPLKIGFNVVYYPLQSLCSKKFPDKRIASLELTRSEM